MEAEVYSVYYSYKPLKCPPPSLDNHFPGETSPLCTIYTALQPFKLESSLYIYFCDLQLSMERCVQRVALYSVE